MRLPKYKVETVANRAQPFDALLLHRDDEASDLDLGGVSVTLLKILRGPGPPKQIRRHTNCYGADDGAGG